MGFIKIDNLLEYAFVNYDVVQRPIRGIVMDCRGVESNSVYTESPRPGIDFGNEGVLYVYPYYGPWSWCNDRTVALLDEILDVVFKTFNLPPQIPFVIIGEGMGGMTAMLYSMLGKKHPVAVACNCPICDLAAFFESDEHMRRSIYNAYFSGEGSFEEELDRHNPILHTHHLPDIAYLIVSGSEDKVIDEEGQIGPFQQAMRQARRRATFLRVNGMRHCHIYDYEDVYQTYLHFCLRHLGLQA